MPDAFLKAYFLDKYNRLQRDFLNNKSIEIEDKGSTKLLYCSFHANYNKVTTGVATELPAADSQTR